jgi:hypothetical protein
VKLFFFSNPYKPILTTFSFITLACEPFDDTLETFIVRKKNSLDFETKKEIFNQITAGLFEYHSINLVHGNITSSQIAISNSNEKIIAKISKFPIYGKTNYLIKYPCWNSNSIDSTNLFSKPPDISLRIDISKYIVNIN